MVDKFLNNPDMSKVKRRTIFKDGNSLDLNFEHIKAFNPSVLSQSGRVSPLEPK